MNATTLVVGLGNPILGDDGVGWRVAEGLRPALAGRDVDVACLSLGGLALVEHLAGYRRAIIVDAMTTGAAPGTLHDVPAADLAGARHTASAHDLGLTAALDLGRTLGLELPEEIRVVGVEALPDFAFRETLSTPVAEAISGATARVLALLEG